MTNEQWRRFFEIGLKVLGVGASNPYLSESWCVFSTFSSFQYGVNYYHRGFPGKEDLLEDRTIDGGTWMQSIHYDDLAHLIVPKQFYWELVLDGKFQSGFKYQDIVTFSRDLEVHDIPHRKTDELLEVKLY
jgi:hypothetical protein